MTETIVLYHGGCRDGFCAAWVVNKYLRQQMDNYIKQLAETGGPTFDLGRGNKYIPAYYGQEPPDCKGKDVIIVDFCYPLDVMDTILTECNSLLWMDHHKTAIPVFDSMMQFVGGATRLKVIFDLEKSGAGLAWDFFFPKEPRPWIVDYVEDRDLWAKKLDNSDEVNAYVACLKFDFSWWDAASQLTINEATTNGHIAILKTEQYVREVCKNVYFADLIATNDRQDGKFFIREPKEAYEWFKAIPIVNICQVDCSEVLHELCERDHSAPFTMYWFKRADGMYQYGLRSIGDFDVSQVAKLFGGGGHKNAAGFQLKYLLEELK